MRRWLNRLGTAALLAAVALVALGAVFVLPGDWQLRPVSSGSMAPTVPIGSLTIVERVAAGQVSTGDVIVFHEPGKPERLLVHRIVSVTQDGDHREIETKGDANRAKDPWRVSLSGPFAYKVRYAVPYVGYIAMWVRTPSARPAVLTVASAIAAYAVLQLFLPAQWWRRSRSRRAAPGRAPSE